MSSYPRYPQPVIKAPSGLNWFLEATIGGVLEARGTTTNAPSSIRDITLVNQDRTKSYQFGLSGATPPAVTLTQVDVHLGNFEDLSVFSPSGREWAVQIDPLGAMTLKSHFVDQPHLGQPVLVDPAGIPWRFNVTATGLLDITSDPSENRRQTLILIDQDGTKSWEVTVNTSGILSVSDGGGAPLASTEFYEAQLISPTNEAWNLRIEGGIIKLENVTELVNQRDIWTVVLSQGEGVLYVVDSRFRSPLRGGRRER